MSNPKTKKVKCWAVVKISKNVKIEMCECHSFGKHMYQVFRTKKEAEIVADSNHEVITATLTYPTQ